MIGTWAASSPPAVLDSGAGTSQSDEPQNTVVTPAPEEDGKLKHCELY